jgi:membrane-associated protease RseP (regulator of RpoE activity)
MRDGREIDVNVTLGERKTVANRISIARPAIASLRARPDVQIIRPRVGDRSRLGVELQGMTPQLAEYFGLSKRSGALVIFVFADSPAAKAGLKAGDVILSAAGETVENPMDIRRALTGKSEGAVEFRIMRDKHEQTVNVQLEKGASSWLLAPDDCADTVIRAEIAPMAIEIPTMAIAPISVKTPKLAIAPISIKTVATKPMKIETTQLELAPIAIPQMHLAPMKVEIPKIHIDPVKVVVVPRRIIL